MSNREEEMVCNRCGSLLQAQYDENTGEQFYFCDVCHIHYDEDRNIKKKMVSAFEKIKIDLEETLDFKTWFLSNKPEIEKMATLACEIIPSEPAEMQEVDRTLTAYYSRVQFLTARAEYFYKNIIATKTETLAKDKDFTAKQVMQIAEGYAESEGRLLSILERLEKSISSALRTLKTEISYEKEKAFNTKTHNGG